jgi:hypothetical protein
MNRHRLVVGDYVREVDGTRVGVVTHIMKDCGLVVVGWPPSRQCIAYDPDDLVKVSPDL